MVSLAFAILVRDTLEVRWSVFSPQRRHVCCRAAARGAEIGINQRVVGIAQDLAASFRHCVLNSLRHIHAVSSAHRKPLAVSSSTKIVTIRCMPVQVLYHISAAGNGEGLQSFGLSFGAAFSR